MSDLNELQFKNLKAVIVHHFDLLQDDITLFRDDLKILMEKYNVLKEKEEEEFDPDKIYTLEDFRIKVVEVLTKLWNVRNTKFPVNIDIR